MAKKGLLANAHKHYENLPRIPDIRAVDLTPWHKVFEQVMKETYEGTIKPGKLSKEHIARTYQELNQGAAKGYGKGWAKVNSKEATPPDPVVVKMKRNLYKFSQAKDYAMLEELNAIMYEDGKLKSWEKFRKESMDVNGQYNQNYLQAEWQTARQSGHHANNWQYYEANKELFPNLKYRTQGDDRVRDEHKALDGIIAPVDSPFWKKYYPPNGWRCRCYVVQTAERPSNDIPTKVPEVKPQFEINVGISGQVFNEGQEGKPHPFFALAKDAGQDLIEVFELDKVNAPYDVVYNKKGVKVEVSPFADLSDLNGNYNAAVTISENLNESVQIRPHINVKGHKNPEFEKNGIVGDRVSPSSSNVKRATSSLFSDKLGKNGQLKDEKKAFLVIDVWFESTNANLNDFISQSWSKFTHFKNLDHIILIKGGKAVKIGRKSRYIDYYKEVSEFLK